MDRIVVQFTKEKETKNAVRFAENLDEGRERGIVGSIYILKSDLNEIGNPNSVVVTISPVG